MSQTRKSVLLYGHLLLSSVGLLAVVALVVRNMWILVPDLQFQTGLLYPWASVLDVSKVPSMVLYFGSIVALAAFYLTIGWWVKRKHEWILQRPVFCFLIESWPRLIAYFLIIAGLDIELFILANRGHLLLPAIVPVWFVVLVFPVAGVNWLSKTTSTTPKKFNSLILFVAMGVLVILAIAPFLGGGMPVENEFPDIPEKTILADKRVVSNSEYINENRIGGLVRYDPYKDGGENPSLLTQRALQVPLSDLLKNWLSYGDRAARIIYDSRTQSLFPLVLAPEEPRQLGSLLPPQQANELAAKFPPDEEFGKPDKKLIERSRIQYSAATWDFVRRNESEMTVQSLAGHFFHHHYALVGPISDYLLGRPLDDIHFLYGWLNTIILANVVKLFGGFSFEHYLQATYLFYPLYFFVALGMVALIFRDKRYVLVTGFSALLAMYAMGFENLRFAPGLNPIRHFTDLFVLFFLYRYWSGRGLRYLTLALAVGVFALFMNKEFGAILYGSAIAASIFYAASMKRWRASLILVAVGIAGVAAAFSLPGSPYNTVKYVLLGVSVPPTTIVTNFTLGVIFSFLGMLLLSAKERGPDWYALLFWSVYSAGLLAYFVWNPAPNHLLSLGVVWALLGVLSIRQASLVLAKPELDINLIRILFVSSLVGLIPFVGLYWKDRHDYLRTFQTHITYRWQFPTASFQTTMDPKPFQEAVAMISKYGSGPEITLISKYASILPWLAGKYNAIPYHELPLELLTLHEVNVTVDYISARKPQYLLVDTDIWRSKVGDIFDFNDPVTAYLGVWEVSRDRALLTQNLQLVAHRALANYKIVEVGPLLSVYERISPSLPVSQLGTPSRDRIL